jgi:hypothetical protein
MGTGVILFREKLRVLNPWHCPIATAKKLPPWRCLYSSIDPELQRVAIKVSAQIVRQLHVRGHGVHFPFDHIHTASRNRMKAEEAADIAVVYWSYRIQVQLEEGESNSTGSNGMISFSIGVGEC